MPEYKFHTVVMCDAVYRDQQTYKAVLAGVYSGDVVMEDFPAELRAAFYAEIIPSHGGSHKMEVRFILERKLRATAILELADTQANVPAILILPPILFKFAKPGQLEMRVSFDDGATFKTLLKKRVVRRDSLSSAILPNSQPSRTAVAD